MYVSVCFINHSTHDLEGFYDDWVLTIRYRLDMLYGDVLTRLMVGQEAAGEHQAALTTARRLLDHDPLLEDAHRLAGDRQPARR